MATIQEEIAAGFQAVGTKFKQVLTLIGTLASLNTTDKSSIVNAINEVNTKTANAGAAIDDVTPRSSTVYSSSKTDSQISAATTALKADILGGAGPTVDTLKEIADALAASDSGDDSAIAGLTTAVGNRLRFDAAQTLDSTQKAQGNANLGSVALADFGDPNFSYVNAFNASLV